MPPASATPTLPFDIVPIPRFAYVPGLWAWLALGCAGFAVWLTFKFFRQRLARQTSVGAITLARQDLEALQRKPLPQRESLALVSLILRRILSNTMGIDASHMTLRELEMQAPHVSSSIAGKLVTFLAQHEAALYGISAQPGDALTVVNEAVQLLAILEEQAEPLGTVGRSS